MKTLIVSLIAAFAVSAEGASRAYELSARGWVGFGDNTLIGGIIVGEPPDDRPCEDGGHDGKGPIMFAIRCLTTSLKASGVGITLYDPIVDFYDSDGKLLFSQGSYLNNTPGTIAILSAYGLIPEHEDEVATVISLLPGYYTAVVRPAYFTSYGNALLELYKLALP
jgi:hypothetical protein